VKLEAEYQQWRNRCFAGQVISKKQDDCMRDAFFAGAVAGNLLDGEQVYHEVARHIESIQPKPERN
jgi:hypothetical protein